MSFLISSGGFSFCSREAVNCLSKFEVSLLGRYRVFASPLRRPCPSQPNYRFIIPSCSTSSVDSLNSGILATNSAHLSTSVATIGVKNPDPPRAAASAAIMSSELVMLAISDWEQLGRHLAVYDELREGVIKQCRDVQKLSKQAVYSLHRGDLEGAENQLVKAEAIAGKMQPTVGRYPALRFGSFSAAVEEYVEARAFAVFLRQGRLLRTDEVPLAEPEEFLGGVLDFTGELNRYAIARATVRDKDAVQRCRDLVDAIMGRFLQFDLRNGTLRKKYDVLKYTLKKMEATLYELALTEGMALKISSDADVVNLEGRAGEVNDEAS